jgi:hypothetical protein
MSIVQAKFSCPGCSNENEIAMPAFGFMNITFSDSKTFSVIRNIIQDGRFV